MVSTKNAPHRRASRIIRLRVSISSNDLGMERLYAELLAIPSDEERRLHVRRLLYMACPPKALPRGGAILPPAAATSAACVGDAVAPDPSSVDVLPGAEALTMGPPPDPNRCPPRTTKAAIRDAVNTFSKHFD